MIFPFVKSLKGKSSLKRRHMNHLFFLRPAFVVLGVLLVGASTVVGAPYSVISNVANLGNVDITTVGGNWVVAFSSGVDTGVWVDDGHGGGTAGDGMVNGQEIRTIKNVQEMEHALTTYQNHIALSFKFFSLGAYPVTSGFWVDDGLGGGTAGDGIVNGGEIRAMDSAFGEFVSDRIDQVGNYLSIGFTKTESAPVSLVTVATDTLRLWIDDGAGVGQAGDGIKNGSELRTVLVRAAHSQNPGSSVNITPIPLSQGQINGHLAVCFASATVDFLQYYVLLWVDDGAGAGTADDGVINGGELRTIAGPSDYPQGSGSSATSVFLTTINSHVAVVYAFLYNTLNSPGTRVKLWIDDGAGGGTADDLVPNGSEIRDIGQTRGLPSKVITYKGVSALAFSSTETTTAVLKVWIDDGNGGGVAGDGQVNGSEIRTLNDPGVGTSVFGGPSINIASLSSQLGVAYEHQASSSYRFWVMRDPPTVTSLHPTTGSTAGGDSVTITGTGFVSGATVNFGANAATSVVQVNATTITAATPAGSAGSVDLTVVNPDGQTNTLTNAFTYTTQAPHISAQPTNQTVAVGQPTSFSVTADGTLPLLYQWQRSNDAGANWNDISGAALANYALSTTVLSDNNAEFRCDVSNSSGTAISAAALLTVQDITVAPNSISVKVARPDQGGEIVISVPVQVNTNISAKIYDRALNVVRKLPASSVSNASLHWDCRNEKNEIVAPGIYMIVIENNGKIISKTKVVVAW